MEGIQNRYSCCEDLHFFMASPATSWLSVCDSVVFRLDNRQAFRPCYNLRHCLGLFRGQVIISEAQFIFKVKTWYLIKLMFWTQLALSSVLHHSVTFIWLPFCKCHLPFLLRCHEPYAPNWILTFVYMKHSFRSLIGLYQLVSSWWTFLYMLSLRWALCLTGSYFVPPTVYS